MVRFKIDWICYTIKKGVHINSIMGVLKKSIPSIDMKEISGVTRRCEQNYIAVKQTRRYIQVELEGKFWTENKLSLALEIFQNLSQLKCMHSGEIYQASVTRVDFAADIVGGYTPEQILPSLEKYDTNFKCSENRIRSSETKQIESIYLYTNSGWLLRVYDRSRLLELKSGFGAKKTNEKSEKKITRWELELHSPLTRTFEAAFLQNTRSESELVSLFISDFCSKKKLGKFKPSKYKNHAPEFEPYWSWKLLTGEKTENLPEPVEKKSELKSMKQKFRKHVKAAINSATKSKDSEITVVLSELLGQLNLTDAERKLLISKLKKSA